MLRLERLLNKPSSYLISVPPVAELIAFTYDKIPLLQILAKHYTSDGYYFALKFNCLLG